MIDYEALAEFRYQIRRFLHFSEQAARSCEIEPQQHQLLLAAKASQQPTIGYLADRLQIRHHSAVELVNRMVTSGLIQKAQSDQDRRQMIVSPTARGERVLDELSTEHVRELRDRGPALVTSLEALVG
jgi:DNA-binding MarR family transcriptional regulator